MQHVLYKKAVSYYKDQCKKIIDLSIVFSGFNSCFLVLKAHCTSVLSRYSKTRYYFVFESFRFIQMPPVSSLFLIRKLLIKTLRTNCITHLFEKQKFFLKSNSWSRMPNYLKHWNIASSMTWTQ